jgi:hypothetical protein
MLDAQKSIEFCHFMSNLLRELIYPHCKFHLWELVQKLLKILSVNSSVTVQELLSYLICRNASHKNLPIICPGHIWHQNIM